MLEQENTQRVKDGYAAFLRGDIPSVLDALADDTEWVSPGPADVPGTGTFRGKRRRQPIADSRSPIGSESMESGLDELVKKWAYTRHQEVTRWQQKTRSGKHPIGSTRR